MNLRNPHLWRHVLARLAGHGACVLVLSLGGAGSGHAAPLPLSVSERLPLVQSRANFLRQSLRQSAVSADRVDADYLAALKKAEQHWQAGRGDDALLALSPLQKYAPIAELPFIKAQLLMAAVAEDKHDMELRNHHRAFATALAQSIGASGNGLSERSAIRLVLPSEADGWLLSQRERYQTLGKTAATMNSGGKHYDRWQVRLADGTERTLYFEVPGKKARAAKPATPAVQKDQAPRAPTGIQ